VDSATKRSRAVAALVQDYGDMQRAGGATSLPTVDAAFGEVRTCRLMLRSKRRERLVVQRKLLVRARTCVSRTRGGMAP
jgi:hypothetical protein